MSDGPAGVRGERWDEREPSANVPSPTALAATWDEARIERLGRLLAFECRRKGVDILLAPTVNLHRSPFGGRHFECFSEDPLLTARIGAAYVRGLQSEGVAATVKHFVANDSETERFTLDARVDERPLRELYMLPFELILEEGPWAVMAAYNAVNGHTMTESPLLDVAAGRVGRRLVMSDWGAARHTERAGNAALDLVMPGPDGPWGDALVDAVRDGRVSEAAVDEKVRRLLRLAERVGALGATAPHGVERRRDRGRAAGDRRGGLRARPQPRHAAALSGPLRTVAVLGPNAAVARTLGGGSATVFPPYTVSPLDGLRAALDAEVTYAPGVRAYTRLPVADVSRRAALPRRRRRASCRASGARPASSRGSGRCEGVAAIEVHATVRAEQRRRARDRLLRRRPLTSSRSTASWRSTWSSSCARTPTSARRCSRRRSTACRSRSPPARRSRSCCAASRRARLDRSRCSSTSIRRSARTSSSARSRWRARPMRWWSWSARRRRSRARASTARRSRCPGRQDELVRRVAIANPRTIVVVNAGAPVLMPWLERGAGGAADWFPGRRPATRSPT